MDAAAKPTPQIHPVEGPEALAQVRALFEEYWQAFGFTPCFQGFGQEVAGLPGRYAPPRGRLAMAWVGAEAAGCVALRPLDERRGEAKRFYVRPAFRGHGLGVALLNWMIAEARAIGYSELVADTLPVMRDALSLYGRLGFERTDPYAGQDADTIVCLRLLLERTGAACSAAIE